MRSVTCLACGADSGTVGVIEGILCPECLRREALDGVTFTDRDFGAGVPGLIAEECYALRDMLHEKNRKYGNSALEPARIFSKASPEEQILVRIDDKISRLKTSATGEDEDVVLDLLGYLILLRIARRLRGKSE